MPEFRTVALKTPGERLRPRYHAARKAPRAAVDAVLGYLDDPAAFVQDAFGVHPDPWQRDALARLARGDNVAVRSGHGVGKTAFLAWAVLWYLATHPDAVVPCTAPTQHQLHDLLWSEAARWLRSSPLEGQFEWRATTIEAVDAPQTWRALARTSNHPDNLAGFHADHLLYVVDEAGAVPDPVYQVIDGALTTEGAQMLMCGNPTRSTGYFLEAFRKNRWAWAGLHVRADESPRVSPSWVEGMARKWGRESDVYRVRVLGDPPLAEADAFLSLALIEPRLVRPDRRPPAVEGPLQIGVDVARYGDSETVVVARRGDVVLGLWPYRRQAVTETAGHVLRHAREVLDATAPRGPITIVVDDTGVGGGVTDLVREAAWQDDRLTVVAGSFAGPGDVHYQDGATRLWAALRDRFQDGQIVCPDDDDLVGQLSSRKYRITSSGRVALESKDDLRRRNLPSPDRADALALAFAVTDVGAMDEATAQVFRGASLYGG